MVKKPKPQRDISDDEGDEDKLFLGDWLETLGIRPAKVARDTGINEGYLSLLINGKKRNPTRSILRRIGGAIGVEWYLLYEQPPPKATIDQLRKYGTGLLKRIEGGRK